MENNITSQYETIGARMIQYLKDFPPQDSHLYSLRAFIERYSRAPLFIVGTADDVKQEPTPPENERMDEFRLPFPTMLLDFPSGLYKELKGKSASSTRCMVYLHTLAENTYIAEVLRASEATQEAVNTLIPPAEREYLMSYPMFRQSIDDQRRAVGDSGCYLIRTNPESGHFGYTFSKDFIYDCEAPCERLKGIVAYSPFAQCKPQTPCTAPTPMCDMMDKSGLSLIWALHDVIAYINRPDRFVVRITPDMTDHEKRLKEKGKKTTFNKKPFHVVIDHTEIRQVIAESHNGHHASPLPHQRRGHWRDLRAHRYKRQRAVWVRPSDVNKGLTIRLKKAVYEVLT